jgi:hypothetical protein
MIYSQTEAETITPLDVLFTKVPTPALDGVTGPRNRPLLTKRTQEESMYLLNLLLQPSSPPEPQLHFSNQCQKPILADAMQNYGAIGPRTGAIGKSTSPDSNFYMVPLRSRRKRSRPGYQQGGFYYEYPDPTVYLKQRKEGKILVESAVGRKKTLIKSTLNVTAKSTVPIIFKDHHGNSIGVSLISLVYHCY